MKIKVFYKDWENQEHCHVADVEIPADALIDHMIMTALEYAYRWTQNIDGSWSMGENIPDYRDPRLMVDNPDFNPNVTVVQPLPVIDGKTWGHRSSMIGDEFEVDGKRYRVATFGFDKVE